MATRRSWRMLHLGVDADNSVAQRHPEAAVVVPPRATAVPSDTAESAPMQRDGHIQHTPGTGT